MKTIWFSHDLAALASARSIHVIKALARVLMVMGVICAVASAQPFDTSGNTLSNSTALSTNGQGGPGSPAFCQMKVGLPSSLSFSSGSSFTVFANVFFTGGSSYSYVRYLQYSVDGGARQSVFNNPGGGWGGWSADISEWRVFPISIPMSAGTHSVTVYAANGYTGSEVSGSFSYTLSGANTPPTVDWHTLPPPSSLTSGAWYAARATGSDVNGNLGGVWVEYTTNGGVSWNALAYDPASGSNGNGSSATTNNNGIIAGSAGTVYQFRCLAWDQAGTNSGWVYSGNYTVPVPATNQNPTISMQVLNGSQQVLSQSGNLVNLSLGDTFYVKLNGTDPEGRLQELQFRGRKASGNVFEVAEQAVSGGAASRTFGPYNADQAGTWDIWSHVKDLDSGPFPGGQNANTDGWASADLPDLLVVDPGVAGSGSGLTGAYFPNRYLNGFATVTRTDATINFQWGNGSPASGIGSDNFSVRWLGEVQAPVSGNYTFTTTSDDGIRLWVNNQLLLENWTDHGPTNDSGSITLTAGQKYPIKIEYYENGGGAVAQLLWQYPGGSQQIVPSSYLYPATVGTGAPSAPTNLTFSNVNTTSFSLNWDASSGGTAPTNYEVRMGSTTYQSNLSANSCWVSGLNSGQAATYSVRAKSADGIWSDWSNGLMVSTSGSIPGGTASDGSIWVDLPHYGASGGDGILDEVHGAGSSTFSYAVGRWYSDWNPPSVVQINSYFKALSLWVSPANNMYLYGDNDAPLFGLTLTFGDFAWEFEWEWWIYDALLSENYETDYELDFLIDLPDNAWWTIYEDRSPDDLVDFDDWEPLQSGNGHQAGPEDLITIYLMGSARLQNSKFFLVEHGLPPETIQLETADGLVISDEIEEGGEVSVVVTDADQIGMKVRDRTGNEIDPGHEIFWRILAQDWPEIVGNGVTIHDVKNLPRDRPMTIQVKVDAGEWVVFGLRLVFASIVMPELDESGVETGNFIKPAELRVAKLADGQIDAAGFTVEQDPDRFYVKVTDSSGGGGDKYVRVWTGHSAGGKYDSRPNRMKLTPYGTSGTEWLSKAMILVSDEVDNKTVTPNGGPQNGGLDDQTRLVEIGGVVRVATLSGPEDYSASPQLETPVTARTVSSKVNVIAHVMRRSVGADVDPAFNSIESAFLKANQDLVIARQRFAQVGLDLTWNVVVDDPPLGVDLTNGLAYYVPDVPGSTGFDGSEASILFQALGTPDAPFDIHLFYVGTPFDPNGTSQPRGRAYANHTEGAFPNNTIIADDRTVFTVAHELAHIIVDAGHVDPQVVGASNNLLRSYTSEINSSSASKRLKESQEIRVLANPVTGAIQ